MSEDGSSKPGAAVNGYRIERLVGTGAMAAVYAAWGLGRNGNPRELMACKVMHASQPADSLAHELMRREAILGMRFASGHPNLLSVYDYFDHADGTELRRCIVMELVDGASLAELRGPDRRLPVPVVRRIAQEVLEALAYLHGRGVLHRDLSPRNILITPGGAVKVADLGLAREMEQGAVETTTFRGTPMYACPEAVLKQRADARADLFTLASVLYELLAGVPPAGKRETSFSIIGRMLQGNFPPLPEDTPSDLVELIMGMLQLEAGARWPQSATEALDLLRHHDQPVASPEELAALIGPARERRRAELARASLPGALPPGTVLMSHDRAALLAQMGEQRSRLRLLRAVGHLVTRHAMAVAGALGACVMALGVVLYVLVRGQGDVADDPRARSREAPDMPAAKRTPAPTSPAAETAPGPPAPTAERTAPSLPVTPPAAPAPPPTALAPGPARAPELTGELGTPRVVPGPRTPAQPRASETAGETAAPPRGSGRVADPDGRRTESPRGARRSGPAPALRRPKPLGGEPPSWARP